MKAIFYGILGLGTLGYIFAKSKKKGELQRELNVGDDAIAVNSGDGFAWLVTVPDGDVVPFTAGRNVGKVIKAEYKDTVGALVYEIENEHGKLGATQYDVR
jgi:hypothetical protein